MDYTNNGVEETKNSYDENGTIRQSLGKISRDDSSSSDQMMIFPVPTPNEIFQDWLAKLLQKIEQNQPFKLDENESSMNDFKHIVLICKFMVFTESYKYEDYIDALNLNSSIVFSLDIDFLKRVLEYEEGDLNELYFILRWNLPKEYDFDFIYEHFTNHLLKYFNMLNTIQTFDPPPLVENAQQVNESQVTRDIKYQTQHYWTFLNDLIKNKLYSDGVKFEEGPEVEVPVEQSVPIGADNDDNSQPVKRQKSDDTRAIKDEAIRYIEKATREHKYQFLYHLLLIYINTYGSQLDEPKEALVDIKIESENGINVDYLLFYEAYTIFYSLMPEKMDNLQNYMGFHQRQKPKQLEEQRKQNQKQESNKVVSVEDVKFEMEVEMEVDEPKEQRNLSEMNSVIFTLNMICNNNIGDDTQSIINTIRSLNTQQLDEINARLNKITARLDDIAHELNVNRAPDQPVKERLISPGKDEKHESENENEDEDGVTSSEEFSQREDDSQPYDDYPFKDYNLPNKKGRLQQLISSQVVEKKRYLNDSNISSNQRPKFNDVVNAVLETNKRPLNNSNSYNFVDEPPNKKGGQIGGDCKEFDTSKRLISHRGKYKLEADHDLNSSRGKKAIFDGQTIFATNVNGKTENLYVLVEEVLQDIVDEMNPTYPATIYEDDFLLHLKDALPHVDEDQYLSMVVDSITRHCGEFVDDFFYYPTIDFILRDLKNNQALYELLKTKIITEYPYDSWWIVADVNKKTEAGIESYDLYLHLIKKEDRVPNNTTLKFYEQDMGMGEVMNIAFKEQQYYEAYKTIFQGPNNDIDNNLFEKNGPEEFTLKQSYRDSIASARSENASGSISVDNNNKIKIDGAIWIRDPAKSIDPLSVEKPVYGNIFAFTKNNPDINVNTIGDISNLYLGYPNTPPSYANPPGENQPLSSQQVFNNKVDASIIPLPGGGFTQYNEPIRVFLKDLNAATVQATVDVVNELLSFWIEDPGIVSYRFILEQKKDGHAIIGYIFTSKYQLPSTNEPFTFEVRIEDFTVSNICHTMIKYASGNASPGSSQARIIQQMDKIRDHPNYRYKNRENGMELNYGLAIIATIKSFGDEGQVLSCEKIKNWLNEYKDLDQHSKNMFLLTSDRPLAGQTLFYNLPLICELLIPHVSFGTQDEITNKIPSMFNALTSKEVNVHHVNGGLLSNKKSLLSVVKTIEELFNEAVTEYYEAYNSLRNKTTLLGESLPEITKFEYETFIAANIPLPPPDEEENTPMDIVELVEPVSSVSSAPTLKKDYDDLQKITAELMEQAEKKEDINTPNNKEQLNEYREKIGKIKQLLLSLEYFDETFPQLSNNDKNKQYIGYIDKQIKHAISVSIPAPLFTKIKAFNGLADEFGEIRGGGINNVKDITKALSSMYDNYEFYSKIFDLHDIACESFKEKISMYIDIIGNKKSLLDDSIKDVIINYYKTLQDGVTKINDKFTEDANKKLKELIEKRENPRYGARERKGVSQQQSPLNMTKEELEQEQQILQNKKKECEELNAKIEQLKADLSKAQATEADIKTQLEENKNEITGEVDRRKNIDKKDKNMIAESKQREEVLKTRKSDLKKQLEAAKDARERQEKLIKSEKSVVVNKNTILADLLSKITKLENKLTLAVQNEMAKVHTKSTDTLKQITSWFSSKLSSSSKGGRNKQTRQHKKRNQKKYTKRYNKKTYRKKTQKHVKMKRHKYTKKH